MHESRFKLIAWNKCGRASYEIYSRGKSARIHTLMGEQKAIKNCKSFMQKLRGWSMLRHDEVFLLFSRGRQIVLRVEKRGGEWNKKREKEKQREKEGEISKWNGERKQIIHTCVGLRVSGYNQYKLSKRDPLIRKKVEWAKESSARVIRGRDKVHW